MRFSLGRSPCRSLGRPLVAVWTVTALVPLVSSTAWAERYEVLSQSVIRFHGASQARQPAPLAVPVSTPPARAEPEPTKRAEPKTVVEAPDDVEPQVEANVEPVEASAEPVEAPAPVRVIDEVDGPAVVELDEGGDGAPRLSPQDDQQRRQDMRNARTRAHKKQLGEARREVEGG